MNRVTNIFLSMILLLGSFLELAIGHNIRRARGYFPREQSNYSDLTWLWMLKELLHFADGSTGMSVYVEYQVRVVCFL